MTRVTIRMFATVREAAGVAECRIEASNLEELLRGLAGKKGPRVSRIIARAEQDPESLVILLNGRNVGSGPRQKVKLVEGDEVSIFPPVSGG